MTEEKVVVDVNSSLTPEERHVLASHPVTLASKEARAVKAARFELLHGYLGHLPSFLTTTPTQLAKAASKALKGVLSSPLYFKQYKFIGTSKGGTVRLRKPCIVFSNNRTVLRAIHRHNDSASIDVAPLDVAVIGPDAIEQLHSISMRSVEECCIMVLEFDTC